MRLTHVAIAPVLLFTCLCGGRTLLLPGRQTNALSGSDFGRNITSLSLIEREKAIQREILSGNVPDSLRRFCPVTVTNVADGRTNWATFLVTPDYLAIGTDKDFFTAPMTPMTAQFIADRLGCVLPTRKMADEIYAAAEVKLTPTPISPSAAMTTVPVFASHNQMVRTQLLALSPKFQPGPLVAGHKKDVVITAKLAGAPGKVAIYGWHQTKGQPIQPLYLGHTVAWVDYSHGIRLVSQQMFLNGETTTVARVLADPNLSGLLSDEGAIVNARYPTNAPAVAPATKAWFAPNIGEFKATGQFGERVAYFPYAPEVKVQINAPAHADFAPDKPVLLILYALPNGNTTEQTIGKKLQPGDDWHFDIQHIGAQTRFLREQLANRTIVVAYLEAEVRSWPAWRRKNGDSVIPEIISRIKSFFPTNKLEVILTGHSGGGSFTFGYLNTQEKIPDDIVRIAFLDSNYAYETTNHIAKLTAWLKASPQHSLCALAYHDSIALLDGKTFVSESGGTWGRSHAMLADLGNSFPFTSSTNAGLQAHIALDGRVQFLLRENPEKKILHTVQVERNGFIHAMLIGTPMENKGYEYLGDRAYTKWIETE